MNFTVPLRGTRLFLSVVALVAVAGCITVTNSIVADPDHRSVAVITNNRTHAHTAAKRIALLASTIGAPVFIRI